MSNGKIEIIEEFNILVFKKRFLTLCDGIYSTFGIDINTEKELYWLYKNYTNDSRYYHTITHITTLLNLYDNIRKRITNGQRRLALQFAIFYHDIIYIPQSGDDYNIPQSIKNAKEALMDFQSEFILDVSNFITATNHKYLFAHQDVRNKLSQTLAYISDMDLAGFGLPEEGFKKNNDDIRKEFSMFSDKEYNEGQIKFLQSVLSLDKIYLTPEFRDLESDARNNIERQIKILSDANQ